jgi:hypothetical protein
MSDPAAASDDNFGYSVAVSGDTALVGAPDKDVGSAIEAGAAYVSTRAGTSWSRETELSDPAAADGDYFGTSVARSGDTALVGDPGTTVKVNGNDIGGAGAAYVYKLYGDDTLSNLAVSAGSLSPSFAAGTLSYSDSVAGIVNSITVTPTTNDPGATYVLRVGGVTVTSPANPIALSVGANVIDVVVTAQNLAGQTYSVTVTRRPLNPTLTLKLTGLKSGVLTLGKHLKAKGTLGNVPLKGLAGWKVTLTVQRKQGRKWGKVAGIRRTTSASGAYGWKYTPKKTGAYRMRATIAKTLKNTAATTKWLRFKVLRPKVK